MLKYIPLLRVLFKFDCDYSCNPSSSTWLFSTASSTCTSPSTAPSTLLFIDDLY